MFLVASASFTSSSGSFNQNLKLTKILLISNFRHVLNVLCFLLGNSPASKFYMPTFRNTLFHLRRQVGVKNELHSFFTPTCPRRWNRESVSKRRHIKYIIHTHLPMKIEHTECSETSAYKIQTTENYPEESIQQLPKYNRLQRNSCNTTVLMQVATTTYRFLNLWLIGYVLFVFLPLQPIVVVISQPGSGL